MNLDNLRIGRVMIHEVFPRDEDRAVVPPRYGSALVSLDGDALDALRSRLIAAMGRSSQSVEMSITAAEVGSMFAISAELLNSSDADFPGRSRRIADCLASAQKHRRIPGGVVVVVDGRVGHPESRWVGVIKAETQNGFTRIRNGQTIDLRFLRDLILTPQTKLYKIGVFLEMDAKKAASERPEEGFAAHIYDDGMTAANRDGAAIYFYEGFLGCAFPATAARLTRKFYEHTKSFIKDLDVDPEKKADLITGLYVYLKVDQEATVHADKFAEKYLSSPQIKDAYRAHMRAKKFPGEAVPKDLAEVVTKLRLRNVRFRSQIKLTAPNETFNDLIRIENIPAETGDAPNWTQITIKDVVTSQE